MTEDHLNHTADTGRKTRIPGFTVLLAGFTFAIAAGAFIPLPATMRLP